MPSKASLEKGLTGGVVGPFSFDGDYGLKYENEG